MAQDVTRGAPRQGAKTFFLPMISKIPRDFRKGAECDFIGFVLAEKQQGDKYTLSVASTRFKNKIEEMKAFTYVNNSQMAMYRC